MNNCIAYVNGEYCKAEDAKISIFDRGFLMGDAVYEVSAVIKGCLIDNEPHLDRLFRSLGELNMPSPANRAEIIRIQKEIIAHNQLDNGEVYLQITRGSGPRDFLIKEDMQPNLVMFPLFFDPLNADNRGIAVQTLPDIRWLRRDIKTTQLLAQSLARSIAAHHGFDDAWMVDSEGYVTEGSANNAYIVKGDRIFTRYANNEILNGITRRTMFGIIKEMGLTVVEQAFTPREAILADEAFITSAGNWATPVVNIDGEMIGNGQAGTVTLELRRRYITALEQLSSE